MPPGPVRPHRPVTTRRAPPPSGRRSSLRADRTDGSRPHDRVPTVSRDRLEARCGSPGPTPGLQAVATTTPMGRVDRSRHVVPLRRAVADRRSAPTAPTVPDHTTASRRGVATAWRPTTGPGDPHRASRRSRPPRQRAPPTGHDTSSRTTRAVTDRRSAPTAPTVPDHTTASRRAVATARRPTTGPGDPHRASRRSRPPRRNGHDTSSRTTRAVADRRSATPAPTVPDQSTPSRR